MVEVLEGVIEVLEDEMKEYEEDGLEEYEEEGHEDSEDSCR